MALKRYNIKIIDSAQVDLDNIYRYITYKLMEPEIAEKVIERIEKGILSLDTFPYRCREIMTVLDGVKYRKLIIENYVVLYKVNEEIREVRIDRVIHERMNYLK